MFNNMQMRTQNAAQRAFRTNELGLRGADSPKDLRGDALLSAFSREDDDYSQQHHLYLHFQI